MNLYIRFDRANHDSPSEKWQQQGTFSPTPRSLLPDPSLKTINKSNIRINNSFICINISFILTNISLIYSFLRGSANFAARGR